MNIKLSLPSFLLALSISSSFAMNPQEIVKLINQRGKQASVHQHYTSHKQGHLQWKAVTGPKVMGSLSIVEMKQQASMLFAYSPQQRGSIYKSIDGGHHWRELSTPKNVRLNSLISLDENTLLLAADDSIYTSTDQGEHWSLSATLNVSYCDRLFAANPNLVFVETGVTNGATNLYRSLDGGKTWTPAVLGLDQGYHFRGMGARDNLLFIGVNGLNISTNKGLLWTRPSHKWDNYAAYNIAVNSQHDVFVQTGNLYKTDLNGKTWNKLNTNIKGDITNLKIDAQDHLYITVDDYDAGSSAIYRSVDNGQTWELLHTFAEIKDLTILDNAKIILSTDTGLMKSDISQANYSPLDTPPTEAGNIHEIFALDENHLFARANDSEGPLYRSEDAGKTWILSRAKDVLGLTSFNNQLVMLDGDRNILISSDQGKTWEQIYHGDVDMYGTISSQNGLILVDGDKFTYFSRDLKTWGKYMHENVELYNNHSYFSGKAIYNSNGISIKRSVDGGQNWETLLDSLNHYGTIIKGAGDQVVLIAVSGAGIIKMTNNGKDWDLINTGISDYAFTDMAVIDENHYILTTDHGVYTTANGGQHWLEDNAGLDDTDISRLYSNSHFALIAGEDAGLFEAKLGE